MMKRFVSLALGLMSCALVAAPASKPPVLPPAGNRFLFVVDVSSSMSKLALASRQTVFDMIYFGVNEQMQKGDTYGLWTFDQEPHAGIYPMQTWHPDQTLDLASRAAKFLKDQSHQKTVKLEPTLAKVYTVIKMVRDLNVFIITDAATPVAGTPFDQEIRSACEQKASARRKAKQPFVITLAARGGALVRASVTLPGEDISLPPPPPPAEITKTDKPSPDGQTDPSATPTPEGGLAKSTDGTNSIALAAATTNREPIIMTNTARAPAQKVIEIRTLTNAAPATAAPSLPESSSPGPVAEKHASPAEAVEHSSATATNFPAAQDRTETAPPAALIPSVEAQRSSLPESTAVAKATLPASTSPPSTAVPVAAREMASPPSPAVITPLATNSLMAAATPTAASTGYRPLILVGVFVLGVGLGLALLSLRRLRQARQPSYISRSLDQK